MKDSMKLFNPWKLIRIRKAQVSHCMPSRTQRIQFGKQS